MAEDRSLAYALADNIIGFDDGYDTLLERGTKAVRKDPMGVARQLGGSLYDSVKDFAGAFARNPAGAVTDTANELGLSYVEAGQRLSGGIGSYLDQGMSVDEARDAQLMDALTMSELLGGGLFANQLRKGLTPNVDAVSAGPDDPSRRKFMAQAAAAIPVAAVAPDVITDVAKMTGKAGVRAAINPLDMAMQNIRVLRGQIDEQYGIVNEVLDNPRSSGMLPGERVAIDDANAMIMRTEQEIIDEAYDAMISMDPADFSKAIREASDEALEEIVSVQYDSIAGNQRLADDGPNITAMAEEMQRRGMHTAKDRNGVSRFPNAETFVMDVTEPVVDSGVDQGLIIEKMGVDYPAGLNMTRQTPPDIEEDILNLKLTELRREIANADRVMRIDGKSTKEIDEFKAQKRREMFELQNLPPDMDDFYAQGGAVEGVGSLSRVARDMFRGPRGIATLSRFAEGGRADNRYTGFDDDREALEALANVEYAADMQKYLDPIARLGFDPDVVKTTTGSTMYPEDAYRKPLDTLTVDTNFGAYAPEVQAHEFRHRGMYDILNLYISDPERFEAEFGTPAAVYAQNILKDMRGQQNQVYSESLAEFFEQPSQFNYPRVYYSETGDVTQSGDIDSYREANPGVDTMAVNRQQDGHLTQFLDRNTKPLVEGYRQFKKNGEIPEVGDVSSDKLRQMYEGAEGMQSAAEFLLERNPVRGYSQGGDVDMSAYREALIASESSGDVGAENPSGAVGLTQAMPDTLEDFKDETGLEFTPEQYANSRELQTQFQDWYEQKTINYIMDQGLDRYIGQTIKGVPITMSSMLGMAHLGGDYGMRKFIETGGRYDPDDGYTKLSDYGRKFANMSIVGQGGVGVEPSGEEIVMSMPVEQEAEFTDPRGYSPIPQLRPQYMPTEPMPRPRLRPTDEEETPQGIPSVAGVIPGRRTNLYEQYGGIANLTNP